MAALSIGALARRTQVKIPTIRYYESAGLLPEPDRTDSNRRVYGVETVERLAFIRHARDLGFGMDAIRALLDLRADPEQPCAGADAIAREQIEAIDRKVLQLEALKRDLERMLHRCEGHSIAECGVIDGLEHHADCLARDHQHPASPQQ